jgi:hypothetical protein
MMQALSEDAACDFAREVLGPWDRGAYVFSLQSLGTVEVDGGVRWKLQTVWSQPAIDKPVPATVVNVFLEVWTAPSGSRTLVGRCTCWICPPFADYGVSRDIPACHRAHFTPALVVR